MPWRLGSDRGGLTEDSKGRAVVIEDNSSRCERIPTFEIEPPGRKERGQQHESEQDEKRQTKLEVFGVFFLGIETRKRRL